MGCGCGGRRGAGSARRAAAPPSQSLQSGVNARQVQVQSNQRQALVQKAKDQLQQQSLNDSQKEIERKRRIQVTLRNRYGKNQ